MLLLDYSKLYCNPSCRCDNTGPKLWFHNTAAGVQRECISKTPNQLLLLIGVVRIVELKKITNE